MLITATKKSELTVEEWQEDIFMLTETRNSKPTKGIIQRLKVYSWQHGYIWYEALDICNTEIMWGNYDTN